MCSQSNTQIDIQNSSRRRALKAIAYAFVPLTPISALAYQQEKRSLSLYRPTTGESLRVTYWQGGELNRQAYAAVCSLLRDAKANATVHMALPLLDVLSWMQAYFAIYGWDRPFIVHSGYRTTKTNEGTEGAAKNSLHQNGMAVDISIQGVPVEYLGEFLARLGQGGVGVYQSKSLAGSGFVHLDVGKIRSWRG